MTAAVTLRASVPHRRSTTAITLGIPAVMVAVVVALALNWRSELPDPIAIHWGPGGEADRFGPLGPHVTAHVVIVMAFSLGMWAVAWFWGREALTDGLRRVPQSGLPASFPGCCSAT